jgi:hypothetical protein
MAGMCDNQARTCPLALRVLPWAFLQKFVYHLSYQGHIHQVDSRLRLI